MMVMDQRWRLPVLPEEADSDYDSECDNFNDMIF